MLLTGMCERPPSCRFSAPLGFGLAAVGADCYGLKKRPRSGRERGLVVLVDGVGFSRMGLPVCAIVLRRRSLRGRHLHQTPTVIVH